MFTKNIILIVISILGILILGGCGQAGMQSGGKTGTLMLQITDARPELDITQVLVTISKVEVHLAEAYDSGNATGGNSTNTTSSNSTIESGWFTVVEEAQTFDLIELENVTELLGSANLSEGKYTQIRLSVDEAVATISGTDYILKVPSEKLKLIKPFNIMANQTTTLTLDFDAQKSIHAAGNKYIMRPTIKVIQE